jgi:hypothetical protein
MRPALEKRSLGDVSLLAGSADGALASRGAQPEDDLRLKEW